MQLMVRTAAFNLGNEIVLLLLRRCCFLGNNVQSTYSLPLSLGIVPAEKKKEVEDNMVKNVMDKLPVPGGCGHWPGHITTGIIGGKYLFQALADAGHKDVALHILETTDYPGESHSRV